MLKQILFLCLHLFSFIQLQATEELSLYFWDTRPSQGFSNFGDALSEALVERIVGHHVAVVQDPFLNTKKLLGMGQF